MGLTDKVLGKKVAIFEREWGRIRKFGPLSRAENPLQNLISFSHQKCALLKNVWYLIVSIPDLCTLTYFKNNFKMIEMIKRVAKRRYNTQQASHFIFSSTHLINSIIHEPS